MSNDPLFRFLTDDARRSRLSSLREAVRPILANNLQTEFTDHTCDHSDEVARLVGRLIEPLQASNGSLTDRELSVLYAACYTHDVGMQYERAGATPTAQHAGSGGLWEELGREERGRFLREHHHEISADMVMLSVRSPSPPVGISLGDADDPALVAALCRAHVLDAGSPEYHDLMAGGGPAVRMDLLSGLLRMADILEESRRRANRPKSETLLLPPLSRAHWWRHYYTRDVVFGPADKTITLVFDFPPRRRDEYARIVPQLHLPNIQKELRRHDAAFARSGVVWVVTSQIDRGVYGAAEDMPADVEAMMLGMLKGEADREAAEHRRHLVGVFEQARPLIARLLDGIDALAPTTLPVEKATQLVDAADQFHQVGALNCEASVLENAYRLYEQAGETERQLKSGLRLIELLAGNHPGMHVYQLIQEGERIAEAATATPEQRLTLDVLKARLLASLGVYPGMAEAYRVAVLAALTQGQKKLATELTAELAEAQYLLGDTEEAARTADELLGGTTGAPLVDEEGAPSPAARVAAIVARLEARSGDVTSALARLDLLCSAGFDFHSGTLSRMLLRNAQAQIRFLAGDPDGAAATLSAALDDITLVDHPRFRVALERNRRSCFSLATLSERMRQHDEVRDAAEISGHGSDYALPLLIALDDQREGQHAQAWPRFWRELRASYRSEEWQRHWEAEAYFAKECATTAGFNNGFGYAAFHAVQALSESLVQEIGKDLLAMRQVEPIRETLAHVLHSKLRFHVIPACRLIETLADAVPDDLVGGALSYLLPFATTEFQFLKQMDVSRPAWEALKALVPRLDEEQATVLMAHISGLDLVGANEFLLERILATVQRLTTVLPPEGLTLAARMALPHAVNYPQNQDHQTYYAEALNALHSIAARSDEDVKSFIGQGLFPPGSQQMDPHKLLLLPVFREGAAKKPWANEMATGVARTIRLQVQEYEPGDVELDPQLGMVIHKVHELEGGHRRVSRMIGLPNLQAAAAYMDLLEPEVVECLIGACMEMVATPHNFIANRIGIISILSKITIKLPEAQRDQARHTLLPLARGEGVSDEDRQLAQAAMDPMNRTVMNLGDPVDLQGMALRGLTRLHQADPKAPQEALWALLQRAIVSPDPTLRREAAYATLDLPQISDTLLTALVCGLRDPIPELAEACYWSLARKQDLALDDFRVGLIVTSLQLALQSPHARVRRGAAALSTRLKSWLPSDEAHSLALEQIRQELATDICLSVRVQIAPGLEDDRKAAGRGIEKFELKKAA